MTPESLDEGVRRAVFRLLVETEDRTVGDVAESRRIVAERFGLPEETVRRIAEEGFAKTWPPLVDCCG